MLDGSSSIWAHRGQNAFLILLSLVFLLPDIWVLLFSLLFKILRLHYAPQEAVIPRQKRRVLVTGVGMTKGLVLARLFHSAGHTVVGADFSSYACGRFSVSISKYYRLQKPDAKRGTNAYIEGLLRTIVREKIDLWVSCSGVASAIEDGHAKQIVEARTNCKAIQFDVRTTKVLHEKDSFIQCTEDMGLNIPATYTVTSTNEAACVLQNSPQETFIMKTIGVDDSVRANMTRLSGSPAQLPTSTQYLKTLKITSQTPWIMQQYISGPEFCTHSLVIRGIVKAFVACPSAELLMHYEALPPRSPLNQAMLNFTTTFAAKHGTQFTGHLSFDFMVKNANASNPNDVVLYPIECNPRAHTAVVLFNDTPELADAYLSLLTPSIGSTPNTAPIMPRDPTKSYYWIGHDLVAFCLLPLFQTLTSLLTPRRRHPPSSPQSPPSPSTFVSNLGTLLLHILSPHWRDGTYTPSDPLPWFILYHLYWPLQFWNSLITHKKWSRINVSTTKMFEC